MEFAQRYRDEGYWRGESLGALLGGWAARFAEATAVICGDERISYTELDHRADAQAAGLMRLGVAPGDRVIVQLPNISEFVVLLFALVRCGAVAVLTLPAHRRTEIEHLARLSEAVGYVIPDWREGFDYRELAAEIAVEVPSVQHVLVAGDPGRFRTLASVTAEPVAQPPVDPAGVGVLLISGGTTGKPKLIPRTHNDYAYNARASATVCALTAEDVYLACLPVAHNFPLACPGLLGTWGVGGTVVMAPAPSPDVAFGLIERERVTVTALVPPLVRLWVESAEWDTRDRSSLRLLQVGGAKLDAGLARRVQPTLGCRLQQVFGMAEGLLNYTRLDDPDELVMTTQGRPLSPADEIRIIRTDGAQAAAGEVGELWTRGPYTLRGYYRAPEYNALAFTADGFFKTGDLVRQLPTGHLIVEGRVKDVINRGGENVSAGELEEHLLTHPAVRQVAVIGLPDERLGELVCAVIVADPARPPRLKELKAYLNGCGLARFKQPDQLVLLDELPTTAVGKINKRELVARLGRSTGVGTPGQRRTG
ncbi:MAG TPA: AMP-binding protein [Pseudonocardiaceae bacterium]|jgi:mycobactin salicyl-AMP ligase|nr:AMP-binding protein [Pseudonocardiaceae bacterium]